MPKKAVSVGKLEKWVRSSEGKKVLAKAYKVAKKSSAEYAKASTINLEVLARPFTRCERIAAGIRAAMARKKAAAGGGQSNVEKKPKPAIIVHDSEAHASAVATGQSYSVGGRQLTRADAAEIRNNIIFWDSQVRSFPRTVSLAQDPRIVLLDFTLQENAHLYEPWVKYGRSHRRGPGDQAMMIVEELLTREGLL